MPTAMFTAILAELRANRSEEARARAAKEAHQFIAFQAREMSSEAFAKFLASISATISALAASTAVGDRLASLALIEALLQLDQGDGHAQCSTHIRSLLASQDTAVLHAAARALGVLLSRCTSTTALSEEVEYETQRALEWLQVEKAEARRLGAVLILKVLAERAPALYYIHVAAFFDAVWIALRDAKLHIRVAAVDALRSTLLLVKTKETRMKATWYKQLLENSQRALKINANTESVHGALLVLVELAEHCNRHFDSSLRDFLDVMFRHKEHKDKVVRRATLASIPRLAALAAEMFAHDYLNTYINFVFANLEKGKARRASYLALGDLAAAVGGNVKPYLDIVMQHFQAGLANKKLKRTHHIAIMTSFGRLAPAAGALLAPYVKEVLPHLFALGLSPPLVDALTLLARHVPASLPFVRQRLLSVLSMLLAGEPFRHVENAVYPRRLDPFIVSPGSPVDEEQIVFALRTLRTFDFSGVSLLDFLCKSVGSYLKNESSTVRTEAVLACGEGGKLHAQRVNVSRVQSHRISGVEQLVALVMGVVVTDADPYVRHAAVSVLTSAYDIFLCQEENVSCLCAALQDEYFETREAVLLTLSRLAHLNPAVVLPVLRSVMLRLLNELDLTEDGRVREESARMTAHLMSCGASLIRPYVDSLVRVLLKRVPDSNARVSSNCLVALGQMAVVCGAELRHRIDSLLSVVISFIRDPTAGAKREVALQVLGQLAQACPTGPTPLQKYPELLDSILQDLHGNESPVPRREILRVLGILGALDPYRRLQARPQAVNTGKSASETKSLVLQEDELYAQVGAATAEEHAPCAAVAALVRVLRDAALGAVHPFAVQALVSIARSMEARLAPYVSYILPAWLSLIRSLDPATPAVEVHLLQLAGFVHVLRLHLADNVGEFCDLVKSYWNSQLLAALKLLESCAVAFQSLLHPHMPALTVLITNVLRNDAVPGRLQRVQRVLDVLVALSPLHEPYFHLIAPPLSSIISSESEAADVRRAAIRAVGMLAPRINLAPHASRLLLAVARALPRQVELRVEGLAAVGAVLETCASECRRFVPVVSRCLAEAQFKSDEIARTLAKLDSTQTIAAVSYLASDLHDEPPLDPPTRRSNGEANKRAAEASLRYSKDDWAAWFRRLAIDLLKDSTSPELASCLPVAQAHPPLSRELFNVAFFSVWLQLDQEARIKLKVNLETALDSPNTPADLMQALLSLAEFMEQHEQDILIDQSKLSSLAERCKAHAKALRYKEAEMRAGNCSSATIESLISIDNQLGQRDSAVGILRFAQQQGIHLKESSYEKLQRWEEALKVYEQRQAEDPLNVEFTIGRMRCLAALGEWEKLGALASSTWRTVQEKLRPLIAPMCAEAAWNLAKWEDMGSYVQAVDAKRVEGSLYRAILAVRKSEWEEAQRCINKARDTLAAEVAVLLQESYERAYSMIVTVQQLSELEEIMQAKRSPERRLHLRDLWRQRLLGVESEPDTWQRLLAVRSLLLSPQDDLEVWIKAASLYRKNGQTQLALKTIHSLLAREKAAGLPPDPHLQFARLKLYWENNEGTRSDAIVRLHLFTNQLRKSPHKDNRLLAKCYLRLGQWQRSMSEALEELAVPEIVNSFRQATDVMPTSAKAWRAWGLVNFEVVSKYETQASRADLLSIHVGPALDGFFRTVALAPQDSLQHLLRVLTLWFKHGHMVEVEAAILSGLSRVSIDNWLQVIPQLIARIHTPVPQVRKGVQDLLTTLGKIHPHALVWPLTVASKSASRSRQLAAQGILAKMRQHSHQLVDQALLVSEELIRVAILWPEMWQEGLEEASRFYFGEHNVEGMFSTLAPLYALLAKGPRTENETTFYQTYARELQEAEECCKRFVHNQNEDELNQAWDVYYNVFKKIGKQLPSITSLELGHCSPALLTAADLQLAVPGTYEAGKEVVKIRRISSVLKVISSKQRPRKILIAGSDGCDYTFLLKGHEDLRQDERVMQLFGLVNTLLQSDDATAKAHLSIQRYSVIPLSPNSGLIGWVSSCDTMHTVLREYREARQIPLNLEHKWMQQMIADYDRLTLMQKLEVFRYALENTQGDDLNKILWLKSRNSEAWLARRTVYTRSLALMSMVGYILGLGDRHPSNLMLERTTGKVIHIDFGDCFEVAMQREKYPERIPFRLTRMLISAMEPSGVEGAFRATCEAVLRLLRQNKESLMAVLEAFVYDPLINWRLLSGSDLTSGNATGALTTLPSLEFDSTDPSRGVGSVSSIWSTSASSNGAYGSVVSRTLGPISYSPSPARQTSLSLRTTNMPPTGRTAAPAAAAADAPPRRPPHKTIASDVESVSARPQEALNEKAVAVMNRISNKLTGKDFGPQPIDVPTQVQRLIDEATSAENLCQCYIGWCPFW